MVSSDIEDQDQFLHRISVFEGDMLQINPVLNPSSIEDFTRQWTTLAADLTAAMESGSLKIPIITAAYAVAGKVTKMVQSLSDLDALSSQLMSTLLEDSESPMPENLNPTPIPPYIKQSHDWLVKNISNPYPSASVRNVIAEESGVPRKDVDNWFIDARKRIGWNDARKSHFSNKRVNIVDAATRFFANDEKLCLSQGAEHALVSILKNAKDLYCDKFDETILATKLAAAVKDLTPETKAEAKTERIRRAQLRKDREAYPSPDRSPEPERPLPESYNDEIDDGSTQSISINRRKRRNSSIKEPAELDKDEGRRSTKRTRLDIPPPSPKILAFPTGLPSPASSVDELLQVPKSTDPPSPSSFIATVATRKRRLSESDSQSLPKRQRHLPMGSCLQAISDPFSLSNNLLFDETSFDGWFQQIFDRPEAAEIAPSGFSVELGSLSDFDRETSTESRSTSPDSEQTLEHPTIEVANIPAVMDAPWNEFDFGWTTNLSSSSNSFRQPNSSVNFMGQEPKPLTQDLANFRVSPHISHPINEFENFFGLSHPPTADPVVISLNPISNETWDFSGSTFDKDDVSTLGKTNAGFENNNGLLASLNFSCGADLLPSPDTIFLPVSQDKIRQEKEKEFRDACEKAQRLALELQKDGLFA